MSCSIRLFLLVVCMFLVACAAGQPRSPAARSGKVDEAAVNALYAQLDAESRRYEAALALGRSGEAVRAQDEVKAALNDLQATAARCDALPGCDANRFLSAYDHLLRLGVAYVADEAGEGEAGAAEDGAGMTAGEESPLIASLPAMERTITLLNGRELAEILTLNDAVKAGLEQWLTQYRPNLVNTYVNYQYMRYRMWPEYHKAGLPEALLFGIMAKESGGRVHAVSRAGASGPLQFMYATGRRFGLHSSGGFDLRFDPGMSARANAAYINEQLAIFNGNLELVLGAYNGGEGRMQRLAGRGGKTSFWDPSIYSVLPSETRDYVPMVLAAAWLFLHPERYNLQFPKLDGRPGSIELTHPATLTELTVCFGSEGGIPEGWFRALRNLNPALDPQLKLAAGTRLEVPAQLESAYARSCGGGAWASLASDLSAATTVISATRPATRTAAAGATGSRNYTVRTGDNLGAIARRTQCSSVGEIARLNGIRPPHYSIRAGQMLKLPACAAR